MIKFYTDINYLTQEFRKQIFPVLLDICYLQTSEALAIYEQVEDVVEANVVIVPVAINYYYQNKRLDELHNFINEALRHGKKVWAYTSGDYGITFRKDVILFRFSGFESKLGENEHILPSFVSDPYRKYLPHEWFSLQKNELPTVGFVGHANGKLIKLVKEFFIYLRHTISRVFDKSLGDYQNFYPTGYKRYYALKLLETIPTIQTHFIYRNQYRAGVQTSEEKKQTTVAFYENIDSNLYTLCMRGAGNFSVRFYETLMQGRIPIVIESDARFPLSNQICWSDHAVFTTLNKLPEDLMRFHSQSEFQLMEIQEKNRKLMLHLLNRITFFSKFI